MRLLYFLKIRKHLFQHQGWFSAACFDFVKIEKKQDFSTIALKLTDLGTLSWWTWYEKKWFSAHSSTEMKVSLTKILAYVSFFLNCTFYFRNRVGFPLEMREAWASRNGYWWKSWYQIRVCSRIEHKNCNTFLRSYAIELMLWSWEVKPKSDHLLFDQSHICKRTPYFKCYMDICMKSLCLFGGVAKCFMYQYQEGNCFLCINWSVFDEISRKEIEFMIH